MKQKAYRFDSQEEKDMLVEKYGKNHFSFVPQFRGGEWLGSGFLYERRFGDAEEWSSASWNAMIVSSKYSNKQPISFQEAMSDEPIEPPAEKDDGFLAIEANKILCAEIKNGIRDHWLSDFSETKMRNLAKASVKLAKMVIEEAAK